MAQALHAGSAWGAETGRQGGDSGVSRREVSGADLGQGRACGRDQGLDSGMPQIWSEGEGRL